MSQKFSAIKGNGVIAFQANDLSSCKYATDSSVLFAEEFERLGFQIFFYTPEMLSLMSAGDVIARGRFVTFTKDPEHFFEYTSDSKYLNLNEARLIFIRQNPPFDQAYIANTLILEHVSDQSKIINNPKAIRDVSEKLWAYNFPDFIPRSIVTSNKFDAINFAKDLNNVVLKSIFNFGGNDVTLLSSSDASFEAKISDAIEKFHTIIVQEFFPSIKDKGDKRVLIACGEIVGSINRTPSPGSILSNMAAGGVASRTTLTSREELIAKTIAKKLLDIGVYIAGLDLISEHLIEVNVTSPTGFKAYNTLNGESCERSLVDYVLCRNIF